jgi:hypothetical protein
MVRSNKGPTTVRKRKNTKTNRYSTHSTKSTMMVKSRMKKKKSKRMT